MESLEEIFIVKYARKAALYELPEEVTEMVFYKDISCVVRHYSCSSATEGEKKGKGDCTCIGCKGYLKELVVPKRNKSFNKLLEDSRTTCVWGWRPTDEFLEDEELRRLNEEEGSQPRPV
jgi:hypothetical protein